MNELTLTITNLKVKIEKLVSLHQQLKKDNERLASTIKDLQKTIEEQKSSIKSLQKSNQDLENNKNEEQNKIVTDTKLKINELVLEIDSCIALLK